MHFTLILLHFNHYYSAKIQINWTDFFLLKQRNHEKIGQNQENRKSQIRSRRRDQFGWNNFWDLWDIRDNFWDWRSLRSKVSTTSLNVSSKK